MMTGADERTCQTYCSDLVGLSGLVARWANRASISAYLLSNQRGWRVYRFFGALVLSVILLSSLYGIDIIFGSRKAVQSDEGERRADVTWQSILSFINSLHTIIILIS